MGQKTNPKSFRLKELEDYQNIWFSIKKYKNFLYEDVHIRKFCQIILKRYPISEFIIRRKSSEQIQIQIYTSKPGLILGKNADNLNKIKEKINKKFNKLFEIKIIETKSPDKSAKLLAESIAVQLEKRIPFRRAMKMIVQTAMKAGVEGIQVRCSGRLGGVEIARSEWYQEGRMPLHTIRTHIDYYTVNAHTIYGIIGIKVWINHGLNKPIRQMSSTRDKEGNR